MKKLRIQGTWTASYFGLKSIKTGGILESVQGVVEDVLLIKGAAK